LRYDNKLDTKLREKGDSIYVKKMYEHNVGLRYMREIGGI